jgi:3-oxoacyl-[acyl-carrier protein] reductase
MSDIDLTGKAAIVTGGARGMGRSMALALAQAGAAVTINVSREAAALEEVAEELRDIAGDDRVHALIANVMDETDCIRTVDETIEKFGAVHVLINNAGRATAYMRDVDPGSSLDFWTVKSDAWKDLMDTNVNGPFYMAKAVTPHFLENGFGRIVNIGVTDLTMQRGRYSPYGVSKAALESETVIWAKDLAGAGEDLTCNCLSPGGITATHAHRARAGGRPPLDPDIMGPPVVWLASDASAGVNGARMVAKDWDTSLDPAKAAEKAQVPSVFAASFER